MRIGVDIDGVLARFELPYAELLTKDCGITFPTDDPNWPDVWNWEQAEFKRRGMVEEGKAIENRVWKIIRHSGFWDTLPAMAGATETLSRLDVLRHHGADIYFITSRPGNYAKYLTEGWLMRHGFRYPTVLIAHSKGPVIAGLELDAFIDDKPENCLDARKACAACRVFLVDAPYNKLAQPRLIGEWGIEVVSDANDALDRLVEDCGLKAAAA